MKTRYMFMLGLMAMSTTGLFSQDALLKVVLENNKELLAAREFYMTATLEARTGNAPSDPELEFGYLFGSPLEVGNRLDFRVSQQLDFPTTYVYKSRMRKIKTSHAELEYIRMRQSVLLRARQLWIERIYLNRQEALVSERKQQSETINEHFRQKVEAGEVGQLAFSYSNLQMVALQGEHEKVQSEIRSNQLALEEITGGRRVEVNDTIFPVPLPFNPDSLLSAYQESPEMQHHVENTRLKQEQKNITFSQHLPKLSAGYYSESVLNQKFKGFAFGISVPLWENHNRVKQAKSEVIFAEADRQRYELQQQNMVRKQLEMLESLKSRTQMLEKALVEEAGPELLALSLESGEISLTEYFYASDFYYRNQQLLLEYKKDQLLTEAALMKLYM